jgi:hypothetical protein
MIALFIRIGIPLAIVLVFALARRYLPLSIIRVSPRAITVDELDSSFASKQWIVSLSMIIAGGVFLFGTHALLVGLNRYLASRGEPARFLLLPQPAVWWFFPSFGALTLSWEIVLSAMALVGREAEADSYNYWSSLKAGFDCRRILRWFALLVVLPVGILTVLALPEHSAVRESDIRECGYGLAGCRTYLYVDARRITLVDGFRTRDGKLTRRAGIVIDFNDGERWSSADYGDFKPLVDSALAKFLGDKTRLLFNSFQTEADIPPLDTTKTNSPR